MKSVRSIRLLFSALLVWPLVVMQVDAQNRVEEVVALTNFKKALEAVNKENSNAPYWFTWNEKDENACSWIGVTCTANYSVGLLDFTGWGLFALANFTPLASLPALCQLNMGSNYFNNAIPDDIGSLKLLSRLDLSNNRLVGSIPSNISGCRGLQYLSLANNFLTGTIPDLSDLVHLQFLLLSDNQLSGAFPREMGELNTIATIDVSRNELSGQFPSLLNSTTLRTLLLDNNSLTGFEEPTIINAPNLQELSVGANLLQGKIPLALSQLSYLLTLNMSFNNLSGTIPSGLYDGVGQLFSLDLSHNQLSGSIPRDLLQPPYNSSDSSRISLSYNLLNGSIPTTAKINGSGVLQVDLSNNQLSGAVPVSLASSASCLKLDNNLLSGDIVDVLTTITKPAASDGTGLLVWYFSNNFFTGDLLRIAFQLTNLNFLEVLDLSNNNLSCTTSPSTPDPLSAVLFSLPLSLLEFYVGGNNFSGAPLPIAPVFQVDGSQLSLRSLDWSDCELEGNISAAVFNGELMPNLVSLNLSHNFLTGPVPENITQIPDLQVLDVSYNNLAGPLPRVTQNLLLGNTTFFVGNEGLCGYPLDPCVQHNPNHGTVVQWWILLIIIGGSLMISGGSCLLVTWRWRVYRKLHEQDADLIQTLMERELVTLMPLRSLKKATNNFDDSAQIGEGGFGTVYMGNLDDGTKVAIKRSKREGSEKDKQQFLNEVRILSQVNHRHLVKLLGCCMENKVALLVFEFISYGNLQEHLRGKVGDGHLSWRQRLSIAVQTADALNYLHSSTTFPIYHRDVKSANILLDEDLCAKVADFGLSKLVPTTNATHVSTALQGTVGYMDPEYWISFQLTEKSDVYSFGVVLLELISAKSPIDFRRGGEETSLVIFAGPHIQSGDLQPLLDPALMAIYKEVDGHGKKSILDVGRLAMRCLELQSSTRPSMNEVCKELQELCLKFDGTFMEEKGLGYINIDVNGSPISDFDQKTLLSLPSLSNRSDSLSRIVLPNLELAYSTDMSTYP